MNTRFDARGVSHFFCSFILLMLGALVSGGCAAGNSTQLELRGGPQGKAEYQFREIVWRPSRDAGGGVEMIGYGFITFYNDPATRDYDPRYPRMGHVILRLHVMPQADGKYAIKMLGPSMSLGPGDDEVFSAVAENAQLEVGDGDKRSLRFADAPTQSRNHPNVNYTLGGMITATPTSEDHFAQELRQFDLELSYRGPPPKS